jgi:hypothetical protein
MIKPIAIKTEKGDEYVFRPQRIFQQDKDKIDQQILDIPEDNKYEDEYKIKLQAVQKHCKVEKVKGKKTEAVELATVFAEFTADNEAVIRAAFAYLTNSQLPDFRFLDE